METILVTGGAGFIGSHAALRLLESGYKTVVVDNLRNGSFESVKRIGKILGVDVPFFEGDIRDKDFLRAIFRQFNFDGVFHFAGLKSVSESGEYPISYYENNVAGTLQLCRLMNEFEVFRVIFSSSATVYGSVGTMPLNEKSLLGTLTNPYGRSKLMAENILTDIAHSDARWSIALLRYFNPGGAHPSGLIGEDPLGAPANLLPFLSRVAAGRLGALTIFGTDYPTIDGTGVRDYIHVMDLVEGHVRAYEALKRGSGVNVWNLGSGRGYSVLQVIRCFEKVIGLPVNWEAGDRRQGDVAECWADVSKAAKELNWKATRSIDEILVDAWRWQSENPNGYAR